MHHGGEEGACRSWNDQVSEKDNLGKIGLPYVASILHDLGTRPVIEMSGRVRKVMALSHM